MRTLNVCVGVLLLSTGCDASKLSSKEAERVFQSQSQMLGSVYRTVYDAVEGVEVPEGFTVETTENGGTVSGSLNGGDGFSGAAQIDGSAEIDTANHDYVFDLALGYTEVAVDDIGVVMDGDAALFTEAHLDINGGALDYAFETSGDLTVTGEASGQAAFDFSLVVGVDVSSGTFNLDISGDVDGFDASEFSIPSPTSWVDALYN